MNYIDEPWGILTGIRPVKLAVYLFKDGKDEEYVRQYFLNEYKASPEKTELALDIAKREMELTKDMYKDGISLYIGVPFCPSRCLYCSFITSANKNVKIMMPQFVECLKKEISYTAKLVKEFGKRVETVYVGGGTPTTLEADMLRDIFESLYKEFDLKDMKEFTVEAGRPDTITREKLMALKEFNVDRISINPQTMNQQTLDIIGRKHTPLDIIKSFNLARDCGFDNINMDLIAGLPEETFDMFRYSLEEVEKLCPDDTTVHTMSIKRSSRLKERIEEFNLTHGNEVGKMVDFSREFLKEKGKVPYYLYRQKNMLGNLENVGYAKPDKVSLYNIYIMEEVQSIIAMGCGGVTKTVDPALDRIERIFNVKEPKDYIERIDEMLHRKDELRNLIV